LPDANTFDLDGRVDSYSWLPVSRAIDVTGQTPGYPETNADSMTDMAIANRPDMVAARFAVATARANLDLAKANLVPNVATGPTYERDESGTLFFGVTAQMDVPVWNTGRPLVRQRSAELQQQLITFRQTRTRAELQVQAATDRYSVARKYWSERSGALHTDTDEASLATKTFEQGQATILEVLSIQDALTQEQKTELDLFHEVSQAAIDVIAALAIDPETLIRSDGGSAKP
jgi:cobalt-zinc-cadmium efflux system outer membrane protein